MTDMKYMHVVLLAQGEFHLLGNWITISAQQCKYCTKQYRRSFSKQFATTNPLGMNWARPKLPFVFGFCYAFPSTVKMVGSSCLQTVFLH